jgi:hypothetical protein
MVHSVACHLVCSVYGEASSSPSGAMKRIVGNISVSVSPTSGGFIIIGEDDSDPDTKFNPRSVFKRAREQLVTVVVPMRVSTTAFLHVLFRFSVRFVHTALISRAAIGSHVQFPEVQV